MPDKVVDASVLAAAAFEEPRADEAAALLLGSSLYAPEFMPYELCSVAWKKARRDPLQRELIAQGLAYAMMLDVTLVWVPQTELFALCLETGLTAYDAAYLYVARNLGCSLATFDARLARAIV